MDKRNPLAPNTRNDHTRDTRRQKESCDHIVVSFEYFDFTQPKNKKESFELWQKENILVALNNKFVEICKLTPSEAKISQHLKVYGDFPRSSDSDFRMPSHVPDDVEWGVIRKIGGQKHVVAGFISDNVFYAVFLDKEHRFWISEKKHT